MADDADGVVLSVRGEARRTEEPDSVVLSGRISTWRDSKAEAVSAGAAALERLTADLERLGGEPLSIRTPRAVLTWSAFSATTYVERHHDKTTGTNEPTGRVAATIGLNIAVRDFGLLDDVGAVLTRHEDVNIQNVSWDVDDDNPGWPAVRADAIAAALRKGADYAAALGVSLTSVEHVADTGLLGGSGDGPRPMRKFAWAASGRGSGEDIDAPSLDPVPKELIAVIEARLRTGPATLPT